MTDYDCHALLEMRQWQLRMRRPPGLFDSLTYGAQVRINRLIPERVHAAVTAAIKAMVQGVLFGAEVLSAPPVPASLSLVAREMEVQRCIDRYRNLATAEGAATGAAGFLVGLADFPLLLSLKLKMLFEVATLYGYDLREYPERVYLLYCFQLAFSSQQGRNKVFRYLDDWPATRAALPPDVHRLDWRTFQQEYRDYIDLAKLAQMLPVVGAAVGAVANYRLVNHLGHTAMMAYRLRYFADHPAGLLPGGP
jgi:hypothetical protein